MKKNNTGKPNEALENEAIELTDSQMEQVSGGSGSNESQGDGKDILLPEI